MFPFPNGITFLDVSALNYPQLRWDWQELDSFLNPKFDPALTITYMRPSLGTHTSPWAYETKSGCTIRYRTTLTTQLEQ